MKSWKFVVHCYWHKIYYFIFIFYENNGDDIYCVCVCVCFFFLVLFFEPEVYNQAL